MKQVKPKFMFIAAWLIVVGLSSGGMITPQMAQPEERIYFEDPVNIIHLAVVDKKGRTLRHVMMPLPKQNIHAGHIPPKQIPPEPVRPKPSKIHPELLSLLDRNPKALVSVLVNLRDELKIPRFPDIPPKQSRESPIGQRVLQERARLIEQLRQARRNAQQPLIAKAQAAGIRLRVLEQSWLANLFLARMLAGDIRRLAQFPEVLFIQPREERGGPPNEEDTNPNNDTLDGRERINSDLFFDQELAWGNIGLLDTGIRVPFHTLLSPPIGSPFYGDCVNGGENCDDATKLAHNPNDFCNHGTSSAAILQANTRKGNDFRGVTAITVDSFKVYKANCLSKDLLAVQRAKQRALSLAVSVIVYQLEANEPVATGSIATLANDAYDAGAINIAANGNAGPGANSVRSPALAHKVIGVGAYAVTSGSPPAVLDDSGRGPTPDNRIKPDLIAPTNTETASNASDTAMQEFGATSGATPYVAGAAMLLHNWFQLHGTFDAGQVYAKLIEAGERPWSSTPSESFNNNQGVGRLQLFTCATSWWGNVDVTATEPIIEISLEIMAPSIESFVAALWWPESPSETHDDIDLKLLKDGTVVAESKDSGSIFEFLRKDGPLVPGDYTLRIEGYSITSGPQKVYYAASAKGCP